MSRQAMEKAISEVSGNSRLARLLDQTRPYLIEVADRLQDDILGIIQGNDSYASYTCFIVTPTRIISVGQSGAVNAWYYTDVQQVMILAGKKKLFGGNDPSFLRIELNDGNVLTFMVYGEQEYLNRVGGYAEHACRNAKIANL
jgi:hypothetical protein